MNMGPDHVFTYPLSPAPSAPPEIDPRTAGQIADARARLSSQGSRTVRVPDIMPAQIGEPLRAYLGSLRDFTALSHVVMRTDASRLPEAYYLHAHAVATAIKLRRQGPIDPKLGEMALASLGQLGALAAAKCEDALGRYMKDHIPSREGKLKPSELFACTALLVNRLLEAFGCELLFGSALVPRNDFEAKLAHGIFAHAMTNTCQSESYAAGEAMSEVSGLVDRVRSLDPLHPQDWHKYLEGADKSVRRAVVEFVREFFASHSLAKMTRPGDPNDPLTRFAEYALIIGKRNLAIPGSGEGVFEEIDRLREKYHRILELQRFVRSRGYEGNWSVDASRLVREDKPVRLVKFTVQVASRDGKPDFWCVATTEWDDSALDPLSVCEHRSEQAAKQAAERLGSVSFSSADGNIHEASYRARGKFLRRIRRTTEHLGLGDILSFRLEHDPATDEGGRELGLRTSDVTLVLAALEAVARALVRRDRAPERAGSGRAPAGKTRPTGSKREIMLSADDAPPPIPPYVPPKKPEEVAMWTAGRADEAIAGRTYTIPEEWWRASLNLLPEGHKPGERAHAEAQAKRKPLEFAIVSRSTRETLYRPYPTGSREELLRYRDEILREFPEADYEVRMQTYRRSTAEIREAGEDA